MEKKFFSLFILIFLLAFVTSYAFCQEDNNAESIRAVSQDRSINTSPWVCVDSMAYTTSEQQKQINELKQQLKQ
ncbi:MAG TPA: hypothetical protein DEO38_01470 [Bacteroidales bacterium]|nr:hypothetical protein [Bacteroidales bacterium]